jgi:hypothetical protein
MFKKNAFQPSKAMPSNSMKFWSSSNKFKRNVTEIVTSLMHIILYRKLDYTPILRFVLSVILAYVFQSVGKWLFSYGLEKGFKVIAF